MSQTCTSNQLLLTVLRSFFNQESNVCKFKNGLKMGYSFYINQSPSGIRYIRSSSFVGKQMASSYSVGSNSKALCTKMCLATVSNNGILTRVQLGDLNKQSCLNYSSLPKHIIVALPALSPTMENGNIASWQKNEGDKLNEGDLLCEIETDKATMEFETPEAGYLAKILLPAGAKDIPVGQPVCVIVETADAVAAFKNFK